MSSNANMDVVICTGPLGLAVVREFIALISKELWKPIKIRAAPRWLITLLGVFDPVMRELLEMMFQSERPFVVGHGKFERAFGASPTPHPVAIRMTLDWYRQKKG